VPKPHDCPTAVRPRRRPLAVTPFFACHEASRAHYAFPEQWHCNQPLDRGTYRVALITVTYSDTTAAYSPTQLSEAANEMHAYFDKMSYGKLNLVVVPVEVVLSVPKEVVAEKAGASGFSFTDINGISVLNPFCPSSADWTNADVTHAEPAQRGAHGTLYACRPVPDARGRRPVLFAHAARTRFGCSAGDPPRAAQSARR
jgi:hypothetical protein